MKASWTFALARPFIFNQGQLAAVYRADVHHGKHLMRPREQSGRTLQIFSLAQSVQASNLADQPSGQDHVIRLELFERAGEILLACEQAIPYDAPDVPKVIPIEPQPERF